MFITLNWKEWFDQTHWSIGHCYSCERAEALRTALQAARILNDVDGPAVATAWFTGCNQHFDFEAPIIVLRDNTDPAIYARVVRAAFEFAHR